MHQIVQCTPGVVELVLIPLRQRLEERRRRRKQGSGSLQVPPTQTSSPALRELPSLQKAPTLAISVGEGCLVKGSLAWGTVGGCEGHGALWGWASRSSQWTPGVLLGAGSPGWQWLHGCG